MSFAEVSPLPTCDLCIDGVPLAGGICRRCADAIDEARGAGPRRIYEARCGRCKRRLGPTRPTDVVSRCQCHVVGRRRAPRPWATDKRPLFVRALVARGSMRP
jgi:hypothetical protein